MIADVRGFVAERLASLGIPIHTYPPTTLAPPAVVIVPDSPYVAPVTIGRGGAVIGLTAQVSVNAASNSSAQRSLDDWIDRIVAAFAGTHVRVDAVNAPTVDDSAGLLTARIPVTIHWTE